MSLTFYNRTVLTGGEGIDVHGAVQGVGEGLDRQGCDAAAFEGCCFEPVGTDAACGDVFDGCGQEVFFRVAQVGIVPVVVHFVVGRKPFGVVDAVGGVFRLQHNGLDGPVVGTFFRLHIVGNGDGGVVLAVGFCPNLNDLQIGIESVNDHFAGRGGVFGGEDIQAIQVQVGWLVDVEGEYCVFVTQNLVEALVDEGLFVGGCRGQHAAQFDGRGNGATAVVTEVEHHFVDASCFKVLEKVLEFRVVVGDKAGIGQIGNFFVAQLNNVAGYDGMLGQIFLSDNGDGGTELGNGSAIVELAQGNFGRIGIQEGPVIIDR